MLSKKKKINLKLPYRDSPSQRPSLSLGFRESNIPTNITRPCFWEHVERDSKKCQDLSTEVLNEGPDSNYRTRKATLRTEGEPAQPLSVRHNR